MGWACTEWNHSIQWSKAWIISWQNTYFYNAVKAPTIATVYFLTETLCEIEWMNEISEIVMRDVYRYCGDCKRLPHIVSLYCEKIKIQRTFQNNFEESFGHKICIHHWSNLLKVYYCYLISFYLLLRHKTQSGAFLKGNHKGLKKTQFHSKYVSLA